MAGRIQKAKVGTRLLRLALMGVTGSGKTFTALSIAKGIGAKIGLIDTENRSSSLYARYFDFDILNLDKFTPLDYVEAINEFEIGYDVLIIDSLSHAWFGALEQVNNLQRGGKSKDSFSAWREVTPHHNQLVDTLIRCPQNLIVTMRSKQDYVMEEYTDGGGKKKHKPVKVGLAPIQRDGVEYEFDIVGEMNIISDKQNDLVITKSRISEYSGKIITNPSEVMGKDLMLWLSGKDSRSSLMQDIKAIADSKAITPLLKELIPQWFNGKQNSKELTDKELNTLLDKVENYQ
jgi:AAA domain